VPRSTSSGGRRSRLWAGLALSHELGKRPVEWGEKKERKKEKGSGPAWLYSWANWAMRGNWRRRPLKGKREKGWAGRRESAQESLATVNSFLFPISITY
jgi:hypothetical protein